MPLTLEQLNNASQAEFAALLDGTYEHSPWVAERAWAQRPFKSVAHLQRAMVQVLREAGACCQARGQRRCGKRGLEAHGQGPGAIRRNIGGVRLHTHGSRAFGRGSQINASLGRGHPPAPVRHRHTGAGRRLGGPGENASWPAPPPVAPPDGRLYTTAYIQARLAAPGDSGQSVASVIPSQPPACRHRQREQASCPLSPVQTPPGPAAT